MKEAVPGTGTTLKCEIGKGFARPPRSLVVAGDIEFGPEYADPKEDPLHRG
jgi:hypothetical protein